MGSSMVEKSPSRRLGSGGVGFLDQSIAQPRLWPVSRIGAFEPAGSIYQRSATVQKSHRANESRAIWQVGG